LPRSVEDGVFTADEEGALRFHNAVAPTDEEVARLLATIRRRIARLLCRRGLIGDDSDPTAMDPLEETSPALAGIIGASVQGRTALGSRAGRRVLRIGSDPDSPWVTSTAPRQAHLDGFDLHANVAVVAHDREHVEKLCRYLLRPPLAQDRLQLTDDGRVLMELRRPWSDGTTHLVFAGVELLEKLAAIIPRPRINLVLYHGVLGARARWRGLATSYGRPQAATTADAPEAQAPPCAPILVSQESSQHSDRPGSPGQSHGNKNESMNLSNAAASVASSPTPQSTDQGATDAPTDGASAKEKKRWSAWSDLMRRAFSLDVLACPRCGERMRLIATIEDPAVVRKILNHLGLSTEVPEAEPARPPPMPI